MEYSKLDYENDKQDALMGPVAPDGKVDPPLPGEASKYSWGGVFITTNADGTVTEEDCGAALENNGDGGAAILRLPTDQDSGSARVVVTARVDKSDTTEIETISNTYNLGWAHSKATELGGPQPSAVAKGAPLP